MGAYNSSGVFQGGGIKCEHVQSMCMYNSHATRRDQVRIGAQENFLLILIRSSGFISLFFLLFFPLHEPKKRMTLSMCL